MLNKLTESKIYEVMQQNGLDTLDSSVPCKDRVYQDQYAFSYFVVVDPLSDYEKFISNMGNILEATYDADEGMMTVNVTKFVDDNQDVLSDIFQQDFDEQDFVDNIVGMLKGFGTIDDYRELNSSIENKELVIEDLFSVSDEIKQDSIEKGLYSESYGEVESQAYIDTLKDRKNSIEKMISVYKEKGASQEKLDDLNKRLKDVEIDIENEENKDKPLIKKEDTNVDNDEKNYAYLHMQESLITEADEVNEEKISFQEIIDKMEQAEDYDEMTSIANDIEDDNLRQEVISELSVCEEDEDDIAVAYSVVTSDLLDYYAMQGYKNIKNVDKQKIDEDIDMIKEDNSDLYNSIWVIYYSNVVYDKYFNLNKPVSQDQLEKIKEDIILHKHYISEIPEILDAEAIKQEKDLKSPVYKMIIKDEDEDEELIESLKEEYVLDDEEQAAKESMIQELINSGMSEEDASHNVDEIIKLFFDRKSITESVEDYQDKLSIEYMSKIFRQMRENGWDGSPDTVDKYFNDIMKKLDPNFKESEKDIERESKDDAFQFIKDIEDAKLLGWDGSDETYPEYREKVQSMRNVNKELNKEQDLQEAKKSLNLSDINFKQFYMENYPEEEFIFKDLRDDTSLQDIIDALNEGTDVYDAMFKDGSGDSVVRENMFSSLSEMLGVEYDVFYQKWLHPERSKKLGESHQIVNDTQLDAIKDNFNPPNALTEDEGTSDETEEENKDKEIDQESESEEPDIDNKSIYDLLVDREGQEIYVGEFNSILQSIFSQYNNIFLLQRDLYNMNPDESADIIVWDDEDMYTITIKIVDQLEGTVEIINVDVE